MALRSGWDYYESAINNVGEGMDALLIIGAVVIGLILTVIALLLTAILWPFFLMAAAIALGTGNFGLALGILVWVVISWIAAAIINSIS